MRKLRLLIAALCACFVIPHAAQAAPFVSAKGYSITPAPGWIAKHGSIKKMDVFLMPQPSSSASPYLYVVVVSAKPGETLEQARTQAVNFYPHMSPKIELVNTGYETVGNARSLRLVETYPLGGQQFLLRQNIVLKGGKGYAFTCFAPTALQAKYAPAFDQMLRSVRWSR